MSICGEWSAGWAVIGTIAAVSILSACHSGPARSADPELSTIGVRETLTALHRHASDANEPAYFALFADDAIFLGTDASERWTKAAFQAYAHPYFSQGKGWTYREVRTDVAIDGVYAWFDQELANDKYGPCRGSGVLRLERVGGTPTWRIVQYNLSVLIPNELMLEVAERIKTTRPGSR